MMANDSKWTWSRFNTLIVASATDDTVKWYVLHCGLWLLQDGEIKYLPAVFINTWLLCDNARNQRLPESISHVTISKTINFWRKSFLQKLFGVRTIGQLLGT